MTVKGIGKDYLLYRRPQDRLWQFFLRRYRTLYTEYRAVIDVSFDVARGEIIGIVGRNGSGKSTLLQMICGTLSPSHGTVHTSGRISALLELGAGFNPDFTGRENVVLYGTVLGMSRDEIDAAFEGIVRFSGIGEFMEQPLNTYSSGMVVRLAFAVAVAVQPDIFVVDEALAVGDAAFQSRCFARIRDMRDKGATILFVSHSAQAVMELCNRALLLDMGELLMDGAPNQVLAQYQRLLHCEPSQRKRVLAAIKRGEDASGHELNGMTGLGGNAIAYDAEGAIITNARVTELNGEVARLLHTGRRYLFSYRVTFSQQVADAGFGMLIKSKGGTELGGTILRSHSALGSACEEGTSYDVRFEFACALAPGQYFVNAGVSAHDSEGYRFLHRIVDACSIEVIAKDNDVPIVGMVDFSIKPGIECCTASK